MNKTKNASRILMLVLLLAAVVSAGGCGGDGAEQAAVVAMPSLEELSGRYEDGSVTFEKVHISDELLASAQKKADDAAANADEDDPFDQIEVAGAGCDIGILRMLKSYEGTTQPNPFEILASSDAEGLLQFDQDEEEDVEVEVPEALSFDYDQDSGTMAFEMIQDGMKIADSLYASYIEGDQVKVSGKLRVTIAEVNDSDFYIDLMITGTKPLSGQ